MEFFNFSAAETGRINRAFGFIGRHDIDLGRFSGRTLVVKTENFDDECRQLAQYYPLLGLENAAARLVFETTDSGSHKILLNKAAISELSYIHTLVVQLVHLDHLLHYRAEFGNVYRLEAEQAIAHHYYEFLLWSTFQAARIATRVHALMAWHEANGEAPPADGCYRFAEVVVQNEGVMGTLASLQQAPTLSAWREGFWQFLHALVTYFGQLAFYQQKPEPAELDPGFPEQSLEAMVGLATCLDFYASLLRASSYSDWQAEKHSLRRLIVAMQEQGAKRFAA